nr:hypothetical protein [Tanacetum cinerariifolium]
MLEALTAKGITLIATLSSSAQCMLSLNFLSLLLLQLSWNSLLPTQLCSKQRRPLLDDYKKGKKINDLQLIMYGDRFKDSNSYLDSKEALKILFHSER